MIYKIICYTKYYEEQRDRSEKLITKQVGDLIVDNKELAESLKKQLLDFSFIKEVVIKEI